MKFLKVLEYSSHIPVFGANMEPITEKLQVFNMINLI